MDLVPNYFFLNDKLYKKIRVVKSEDYVVAWSYEDEKRMRYSYSGIRREASKAYDLSEVATLIDKKRKEVLSLIDRNIANRPSGRLYSMSNRKPGKWMWSEQDILDLRDSIFEMAPKNKYGEPYANFKLISKSELLSKLQGENTYYVKSENGEFVKVWRSI